MRQLKRPLTWLYARLAEFWTLILSRITLHDVVRWLTSALLLCLLPSSSYQGNEQMARRAPAMRATE